MTPNDQRAAEALERFWDGLVHEAKPEPEGVDPETAELVRRLHALGEPPDSDRARARVWTNLSHHPLLKGSAMSTTAGLARPPIRFPIPPPRVLPTPATSPRRVSPRRVLNAFATVLLLMATIGGIYFSFIANQLATPSSGVRPDDWPTFRGNAGRTGAVTGPVFTTRPVVAWTVTGRRAFFPVSVANGVVYALSGDGVLHAVDALTGSERWTFATGGVYNTNPVAYPAIDDGMVYAGSSTGTLFALDAESGAQRWSVTTGGSLTTPLAVVNGLVYAGSADGNLYAIGGKSGKERWRAGIGSITAAGPAVDAGLVFAAADDGTLYALDAATGSEKWRTVIGRTPKTVVAASGLVFFSGDTSDLIALDEKTGAERWRLTAAVSISPAIANGIVYAVVNDNDVYALDATTGSIIWHTRIKGSSSLLVAGDIVYGIGNSGLYALDASTGQQRWLIAGPRAVAPPSAAEGMLFVAGGNGVLTAFAAAAATPAP